MDRMRVLGVLALLGAWVARRAVTGPAPFRLVAHSLSRDHVLLIEWVLQRWDEGASARPLHPSVAVDYPSAGCSVVRSGIERKTAQTLAPTASTRMPPDATSQKSVGAKVGEGVIRFPTAHTTNASAHRAADF